MSNADQQAMLSMVAPPPHPRPHPAQAPDRAARGVGQHLTRWVVPCQAPSHRDEHVHWGMKTRHRRQPVVDGGVRLPRDRKRGWPRYRFVYFMVFFCSVYSVNIFVKFSQLQNPNQMRHQGHGVWRQTRPHTSLPDHESQARNEYLMIKQVHETDRAAMSQSHNAIWSSWL